MRSWYHWVTISFLDNWCVYLQTMWQFVVPFQYLSKREKFDNYFWQLSRWSWLSCRPRFEPSTQVDNQQQAPTSTIHRRNHSHISWPASNFPFVTDSLKVFIVIKRIFTIKEIENANGDCVSNRFTTNVSDGHGIILDVAEASVASCWLIFEMMMWWPATNQLTTE